MKNLKINSKYFKTLFIGLAVIVIAWAAYYTVSNRKETYKLPTQSRPGYIDGDDAVEQVMTFYTSYINSSDNPDRQKKLVELMGSKNLSFYRENLRKDFDPITCSPVNPVKVTAKLGSTGSVAEVIIVAELPDQSKITFETTVVLHDSLQIDSISCTTE